MTQRLEIHRGQPSVLPWVWAVLAMIAGTTLFMVAGGVSFGLADADSQAGPWAWLTVGGVLLAVAGFLFILFLASNVLIHRQRESILPATRLR